MARPRFWDGGDSLQIGTVAENILSSHGDPIRSGPPKWGLGEGLTTSHRKKTACYEMLYMASELYGYFGTNQATKTDTRFGTWNVKRAFTGQVH
jgi:hypothetical protein